jgi:hypothetical protein
VVSDACARLCSLVVKSGYSVEVGTKDASMSIEGEAAILSLTASCHNRLTQTRQNVREVLRQTPGKKVRVVCELSPSEYTSCSAVLQAGYNLAFPLNDAKLPSQIIYNGAPPPPPQTLTGGTLVDGALTGGALTDGALPTAVLPTTMGDAPPAPLVVSLLPLAKVRSTVPRRVVRRAVLVLRRCRAHPTHYLPRRAPLSSAWA